MTRTGLMLFAGTFYPNWRYNDQQYPNLLPISTTPAAPSSSENIPSFILVGG